MCAKKYSKVNRRKGRIYIPHEKEKKGPSWITIGILALLQIWPIALLLLGMRLHADWKNKKIVDYRNYAAIIGERCEVEIHELSAKLGKTPALVQGDIQSMIDKGYLGENAYIDRSRGVLVLDALETQFVETDEVEVNITAEDVKEEIRKAAQTVREEFRKAGVSESIKGVRDEFVKSGVSESIKAEFRRAFDTDAARVKEEEPAKEDPAQAAKPDPEAFSREDDFESKLREIRKLNDEIDDEGVSDRIDRIGELTASIFTVVDFPAYAVPVMKYTFLR
jgi:hypothetical protein